MNEELAILCAKAQAKNDCDNYVWELVNCLYGSDHADRVVKFMNSEIVKKPNLQNENHWLDTNRYIGVVYTGTGSTKLPDDITCIKCGMKLDGMWQPHTCKEQK